MKQQIIRRKEERLAERFTFRAQIPMTDEQDEIIERVARDLKKRMGSSEMVMNKGAVVRGLIDLLAKVQGKLAECPAPQTEDDLVKVLQRAIFAEGLKTITN